MTPDEIAKDRATIEQGGNADASWHVDNCNHTLIRWSTALDEVERLRARIATIADEAFGPFPVQDAGTNLTAIAQGIAKQHREVERLRSENDQRRKNDGGQTIIVVDVATFDELIAYGKAEVGDRLVAGMPWAFVYKEHMVTHENDDKYLVTSKDGTVRLLFCRGDILVTDENGTLHTCKPAELANGDE